jgi:hypothetical protein
VESTTTLPRLQAKCLAEFRQDHRSVVDQDDADFTRINPAIVPEALPGEIIDGPNCLDPGETNPPPRR